MNNINRGILFIGNYPINVLNGAAKIRIWNINRVLKPDYSVIGFITKRLKGYYKLFRNNEIKNIKYVYVEPSASTANPVDLIFLIFLKMKNVHIAIFIRDVYPFFKDYWSELTWYQIPHFLMWFIALFVYLHVCKTRFYPGIGVKNILNDKHGQILPPGCNLNFNVYFNERSNIILYTGKLNKLYGEELIIQIATLIKKQRIPVIIGVVFRGDISHITSLDLPIIKLGNILSDIKEDILIGIIPREINPYNKIAFPLKLVDYIQMGIPVLVTDCDEMANFITKNQAGYILNEQSSNWVSTIQHLHENNDEALKLHNSVMIARRENSWEKRVKIIIDDYHKHLIK